MKTQRLSILIELSLFAKEHLELANLLHIIGEHLLPITYCRPNVNKRAKAFRNRPSSEIVPLKVASNAHLHQANPKKEIQKIMNQSDQLDVSFESFRGNCPRIQQQLINLGNRMIQNLRFQSFERPTGERERFRHRFHCTHCVLMKNFWRFPKFDDLRTSVEDHERTSKKTQM